MHLNSKNNFDLLIHFKRSRGDTMTTMKSKAPKVSNGILSLAVLLILVADPGFSAGYYNTGLFMRNTQWLFGPPSSTTLTAYAGSTTCHGASPCNLVIAPCNGHLMGFNMSWGEVMNSYSGICADGTNTAFVGGADPSGDVHLVCPGMGNYVTQVDVTPSTHGFYYSPLNLLKIYCRDGSTYGPLGGGTTSLGTMVSLSCPGGSYPAGFRGYAGLLSGWGYFPQAIALICGTW